MREVTPIMHMLNEMKAHSLGVNSSVPIIRCKVFEDNSGALEMATTHKF